MRRWPWVVLIVASLALVVASTVVLVLEHGAVRPGARAGSQRTASPSATATAAPSQKQAPSPTPTPAPTAQPTPVVVTPDMPSGGVDQALATARSFLAVYPADRWDDGATTLRDRVRPYVTDRFDRSFEQGGGRGIPEPGHPVNTVQVQSVDSPGLAPDGRLVVTGLVAITTRTDDGTSERDSLFELRMVRQPNGWRVDEVTWS